MHSISPYKEMLNKTQELRVTSNPSPLQAARGLLNTNSNATNKHSTTSAVNIKLMKEGNLDLKQGLAIPLKQQH